MVILGDPEMVDVFMQSRKTFQPLYQSQFFLAKAVIMAKVSEENLQNSCKSSKFIYWKSIFIWIIKNTPPGLQNYHVPSVKLAGRQCQVHCCASFEHHLERVLRQQNGGFFFGWILPSGKPTQL